MDCEKDTTSICLYYKYNFNNAFIVENDKTPIQFICIICKVGVFWSDNILKVFNSHFSE